MRFQLRTYKQRKPKGKTIKAKLFHTPKAARNSQVAKEAVYYEIIEIADKRIIEVKMDEVNNGHR